MWYVYIVKCSDNTFYTGITVDLEARIKRHNSGKASKYTKARLPVTLLYSEEHKNRSAASKKEYRLKCFSRAEKEHLIEKK